MYWLIFNFATVALTGLIIPSAIRYLVLKRPLNKAVSALIVGANAVLVVTLWVFLRSALLPDERGGTPTYLLLGVTLGIFVSWAMLTQKTDSTEPTP
ncbi:MAG: hypothetical protein QOD75_1666 [Blastocatellia bacterium]|jgi:hypothetical protein|nr:hypothetical protein [Blastocatellia bacterium]